MDYYKKTTKNRIYRIWKGIKSRCYDSKHKDYKYYGAKGIRICEEWLDEGNGYYNFVAWALSNGYSDDLTVDRKDSTKEYSPGNCQWKTMKEQERNKTNNHPIIINGVTKLMIEWAEEYGIPYKTFKSRVRAGRDESRLLQPVVPDFKNITINGETKNIRQWAKDIGMNYDTLRNRLRRGITGEALLAPVQIQCRKKT